MQEQGVIHLARTYLGGRRLRIPKSLALLLAGMALVWAGTTFTDFLGALAQRESSMNPASINQSTHYIGLFQMGELALQDINVYSGDGTRTNDWLGGWTGKYGATSKAAFLADPQAQIQAETAYMNLVWNNYLAPKGAANYLGQTINGILITQSGLVAAAHLVGHANVTTWLRTNGATSPADGSGTRMTDYLQRFAGYSLSAVPPTYAAIKAATPTGGAAVIITPPPSPFVTSTPGVYSAPLLTTGGGAPTYANPADGFQGATGYQMSDVRDLMAAVMATLALLWLAYTVSSTWQGFNAGAISQQLLSSNVVRGSIVVMLLVMLSW